MDTRNLQTFVYAAEYGSFTKTAEVLGYTQSTISFQIKQLEAEAGCMLFERINHRITLTSNGQRFLEYAREVLKTTNELKEDFATGGEISGHISIATSDSHCELFMLNDYPEFHSLYPKIELEFITTNTEEMHEMIAKNKVDILFTLDSHVFSPNYIIAAEEKVKIHFVTSSASPLATKKHLSLKDVVGYPFVLTEKGISYRNELEEVLASNGIEIKPMLELGQTSLICRCLEDNTAISLLPDFVTEPGVKSGKLVRLEVNDFSSEIWKQLIYHKNKWLSAPLRAFIEFVKNNDFTQKSN